MSTFLKTGAIAIALSIGFVAPAAAGVIYNASIDTTLSLTSVSIVDGAGDLDIEVFGEAFLVAADAFSDGEADSDFIANLAPGILSALTATPITTAMSATGSATGIGFADSFALGDGFVEIFNNSDTNRVQLDFSLEYSVTAFAAVDDQSLQEASAFAFLSLQSSEDSAALLEVDFISESGTPGPAMEISDILNFSLFVGPQGQPSLTLLSDVSGFLTSDLEAPPMEVPLPSMAGLFGLSALVMCLRRRRRDRA